MERAIEGTLWLDLSFVVETVGVIGKVLQGGYRVVCRWTLGGVGFDWVLLAAGPLGIGKLLRSAFDLQSRRINVVSRVSCV